MNKLFLKVGAIVLGAGLVVGSGVAIAAYKESFKTAVADSAITGYDPVSSISEGDVVYFTYVASGTTQVLTSVTSGTKGEVTAISGTTMDTTYPLTVGKSGGNWTFKDKNNKYVAFTSTSTSSNNKLWLVDNATDNGATWTVSFSGTTATIVNVYNSGRTLRGNTTSGQYRICGYTSSSTFALLSLYKEADSSLKDMRVETNSHAEGPYYIDVASSETLYLLGWDIDGNASLNSGCTWTVSDPSVINYSTDGYTWLNVTPKAVGKTTVTCSHDGFKDASATIIVYKSCSIQDVYSTAKGIAVDVYGYFAGNKDGNNLILMDGAYGIDVYKSGSGTNSYVEDETIIHVFGEVDIYNGLYEISNVITLEVVSSAAISTPITYATQGGETAEYASRRTTVSGTVKSVTPKTTAAADYAWDGSEDVTIVVTVGSTDVNVFYKKAQQNATDGAKILAAVGSGELTFKGFTAWYNAFQVQMTGLVEESTTYTAAAFAQELLDLTDAVCEDYDGVTNNHDALVLVWNTLSGVDKYPTLPAAQKTILGSANADEDSTDVVEKAMARYDYLVGKYALSNFITGRTPSSGANTIRPLMTNNTALIAIIASSIAVISAVALVFVLKRKKHN